MASDRLQIERAVADEAPRPIDLARERPFRLGDLAVTPALRELVSPDGTRRSLEPRVMQVLVALSRAHGQPVSRDELIETCWGGTVVGEGSINRVISLLRGAAEAIGGAPFRIETIPKVGYRLVLARPGPVEAPHAHESAPRRRLAWLVLAALAVALAGAFVFWRPVSDGPIYSVSIEPFGISGQAPGFNEELLSTLTSQDVPTVAGQIRLTLTGRVEEQDGAIRINARLTDVQSGELVWSGAIERAAADPGGIAAAASVVGSVAQCALAGANDAGRALPLDLLAAYARTCELGLRGQQAQGVRVARELTRRAPEFAAGWFALSFHAATLYNQQPREQPELRAEALAAADKLIELRPQAQDGYAAKYLATDSARLSERERLLVRATQLEPLYVDIAPSYLADFRLQLGRFEEGFQLQLAAQRRAPDAPPELARTALAAAAAGRSRAAEEMIERVAQLEPGALPMLRWREAMWAGDWAAAERFMPRDHPALEAAARATYRALASGDPGRKEAAAELVRALPADCCARPQIELLTLLGRPAEAIALLDAFVDRRTPATRRGLPFLSDPAMRPLWFDPTIVPFFRRAGWIAYWQETRVRPDPCKEVEPPAFCDLLTAS